MGFEKNRQIEALGKRARQNLDLLKDQSEKPIKPFAVIDIESMNWIDFLVLGFYDGRQLKFFHDPTGISNAKYVYTFIDWLFLTNFSGDVFAHFGGRFDFLFLLRAVLEFGEEKIEDLIPWGSGMLCFTLVRGKHRITFRDSSALLPFSLKKITENFGVSHAKKDWDHNKTTGVTEELLEYLKYDLLGLYQSLEAYYSTSIIRKAGQSTTQAGQSLRILRGYLKKPVYALSEGVDSEIRPSFFGGRTEIFKPFYRDRKKPLYCFDVNSLYPTVMGAQGNQFPNKFEHGTYEYEKGKLGIYQCKVSMPKMYIPPLGVSLNGKYIFGCGEFEGFFTTPEIEYARSLGAKIAVSKGWIFSNGGEIFARFIQDLYQIRLNSKSKVESTIAKLLMNSCYGRFALRADRQNIVFDDGSTGLRPLRELKVGEKTYRLMTKDIELDSFSNVAVACYVTAYARIHMHKLMCQAGKNGSEMYYTDTDSMYTTHEFETGSGLGQLKLEDTVHDACFLLPKTYRAGKKIVMKGFDKKKIQHFEVDDFFACLEGDMQILKVSQDAKFATLKTALKKGFVVGMTEASTRQIRSRYDKRVIVKSNGKYDTKPIEVNANG